MQLFSLIGTAAVTFMLASGFNQQSSAEKQDVTVIEGKASASDGDSLRINGQRIRLEGIDAPELKQQCYLNRQPYDCGETSKEALVNIVTNENVLCHVTGQDQYSRYLAHCYVNGENINAAMVSFGTSISV